jgi:hypothetical protein
MVKIYVRKIKAGMLWSKVPSLWRADVVSELESEGYTCNEDGTVTKVEPVEDQTEVHNI